MLLLDIEKAVKPLSKKEKEQLIRDVQRMLVDEEISSNGEQMLREMFPPGLVIPMDSPGVFIDNADYEAAEQLQQFMKEHEHEV